MEAKQSLMLVMLSELMDSANEKLLAEKEDRG